MSNAVNVAAPESIGPTPEPSGRAASRASGPISDAYDTRICTSISYNYPLYQTRGKMAEYYIAWYNITNIVCK